MKREDQILFKINESILDKNHQDLTLKYVLKDSPESTGFTAQRTVQFLYLKPYL